MFYRDMARIRRFDLEATALQRQGQLGLWASAIGQEGAQIGSGHGVGHNDHIFPSYREHGVALTHGVELISILKMMRGVNHGGWDPEKLASTTTQLFLPPRFCTRLVTQWV